MNTVAARDVIEGFVKKAREKADLPFGKLFLLGLMAGAYIAVGYLAFVRVSAIAPKAWGSFSTFLGACLFPLGLLAITFLGGELVTGNMMVMTFGLIGKTVHVYDAIKCWVLGLIFNVMGGFAVGYFFGHVVGLTEGDYAAKTIAVAAAKLGDTPLKMIISGVGCNILVCMAVFFGATSKDFLGKIVGIWFPIMVFVICGFQHVVANAFILTAGYFAGGNFAISAMVQNILLVFLGNLIGGTLFLAVPVYLANMGKKQVAHKTGEAAANTQTKRVAIHEQ